MSETTKATFQSFLTHLLSYYGCYTFFSMTSIMQLVYSSALIGSFLEFLPLPKKWSSFVLLPSLLSLLLTIALSSLLSKLLISISFGFFFLEVLVCSFVWNVFFNFFILLHFLNSFYELGETATSPRLKGVPLFVSIPCVDCVYQMTGARVCVTRGSPRIATPRSVWQAGRTWAGHRLGSILRIHKQWHLPGASNLEESQQLTDILRLIIEFPFHLVQVPHQLMFFHCVPRQASLHLDSSVILFLLNAGHYVRCGLPVDTMSPSFLHMSLQSLYVQKLFNQSSGLLQEKLLCVGVDSVGLWKEVGTGSSFAATLDLSKNLLFYGIVFFDSHMLNRGVK